MGLHISHAIWAGYLAEEFRVSQRSWVSLMVHVLMGYRCRGETVSIRAMRGILAIIVLFAILFYTLLNVIFAPIQETALSPVKSYRISGVKPYDLLEGINYPAWTVNYVSLRYTLSLNDLFYQHAN